MAATQPDPARRIVWLRRSQVLAPVLLLALAVGALYGASVRYGVFWDDPTWFGRAAASRFPDVFHGSFDYQFYRPLTLLYFQLAWRNGVLDAPAMHLVQLCWHLAVAGLTLAVARRWTGSGLAAGLAAALVVVFPFGHQAVSWAATQQPMVTAFMLAAVAAGLRYQSGGRRRWLVASLVVYALAVFLQEAAAPLWLLFVLLAVWPPESDGAASPDRRLRGAWWWLGYAAIAGAYAVALLRAARRPGIAGAHFEAEVAAYLLQAVAFPTARLFGSHVAQTPPAVLAALFAATWLVLGLVMLRGRMARAAALASVWVALALAPVWAFLGWPYVAFGPRLVYPALPGIAILWAGALAVGWRAGRAWVRPAAWGATAIIFALCLADTWRQDRMLAVGTQHLAAAVAAQSRPGERLLFVNFPDRYRLRTSPYPFGFWGITLAPVVEPLSAYAVTLTGQGAHTDTWAMPQVGTEERAAWPYAVDLRGVRIEWPQLVEHARSADAVYLSRYRPDGTLRLDPVGEMRPSASDSDVAAADFGVARLLRHRLDDGSPPRLHLWWQANAPGGPRHDDTIFVHLQTTDGQLAATQDGDTWSGLLPPKAWPGATIVHDIRSLDLPPLPAGRYQLRVGLYNRGSGQRYPNGRDTTGVNVGVLAVSAGGR